jgi:hypothetical protein
MGDRDGVLHEDPVLGGGAVRQAGNFELEPDGAVGTEGLLVSAAGHKETEQNAAEAAGRWSRGDGRHGSNGAGTPRRTSSTRTQYTALPAEIPQEPYEKANGSSPLSVWVKRSSVMAIGVA